MNSVQLKVQRWVMNPQWEGVKASVMTVNKDKGNILIKNWLCSNTHLIIGIL